MPQSWQDLQFAVIDVETTGLFPKLDRVIEVTVLRINGHGKHLDSLETLINPDRDLGPIDVHGIHGAEVAHAPRFAEIADHLLASVSDAILVGHNVRFDLSFLRHEFIRLERPLPELPSICTLRMAGLHKLPSRRLSDCCRSLGIQMTDAHSSAGDAHATATLFVSLLTSGSYKTVEELGCRGMVVQFKRPTNAPVLCPRTLATANVRKQEGYLASLVQRLPEAATVPKSLDVQCYLEVLDRCLEDRTLEMHEVNDLVGLATEFGMTTSNVMSAHRSYYDGLLSIAFEDGVVTEDEQKDLLLVSRLLGLDASNASKTALVGATQRIGEASLQALENFKGKTVCFTGETHLAGEPISRETAQQLASQAGLVVLPGVTKKLDILVVADPNSLSGKAKKAREYGVRIMADTVFWQKLGVAKQAD